MGFEIMKKTKVFVMSLVAAFSTSVATVSFANDDVFTPTPEEKEQLEAVETFQPGVRSFDLDNPESWDIQSEINIEAEAPINPEGISTRATSKPFSGGKGYTYVVDEGIYYEGVHGTIPNQLTPVVQVHGWIGKQAKSASKVTWVDDKFERKIATKSAADVNTGTNKQAKGSVGTLIYGEASHSISLTTGTFNATTNDAKVIK